MRFAGSIFLIILLTSTDAALNTSRAITFSDDPIAQVVWASVAICIAIAAAWIPFHGDKTSQLIGYACCAGSIMFSYTAVESFVSSRANADVLANTTRSRLEADLANKDQKISDCLASRYCVSQKMREDFAEKELALLALPAPAADMGDNDKLKWKFFLFSIIMPLAGTELSRQIGSRKKKAPVEKAPDKKVLEKAPQLGALEQNKSKKPKLSLVPTSKKKVIPRVKLDDRLTAMQNAYDHLVRIGEKVTYKKLQSKAGINAEFARKWWKDKKIEIKAARGAAQD